MSYRCAFLGCGPRSHGRAQAYEQITRGRAVACCDLDREQLLPIQAFRLCSQVFVMQTAFFQRYRDREKKR
jgi:hypothetical protein